MARSSSFRKLGVVDCYVKGPPPMVNGIKQGENLKFFTQCSLPDSMDADILLGYGINDPHSVWLIMFEGKFEILPEYVVEIAGVDHTIRNVRPFPNFKKNKNTSYEVLIQRSNIAIHALGTMLDASETT